MELEIYLQSSVLDFLLFENTFQTINFRCLFCINRPHIFNTNHNSKRYLDWVLPNNLIQDLSKLRYSIFLNDINLSDESLLFLQFLLNLFFRILWVHCIWLKVNKEIGTFSRNVILRQLVNYEILLLLTKLKHSLVLFCLLKRHHIHILEV